MVEVHAVESILWDTAWELTQHNMASDNFNKKKRPSNGPLTLMVLWKNNLVCIVMADPETRVWRPQRVVGDGRSEGGSYSREK